MENQTAPQSPAPSPNFAASAHLQMVVELTQRANSGANWFFWIAGLSIVNTLISYIGETLSFVVGLGVTQFVDAIMQIIAEEFGSDLLLITRVIGLVIDLVIAGVFVVFGFLGRKHIRWAMIVGMVLYALDALLFLWAASWMGFLFHLLALYYLFRGWQAIGELNELKQNPQSIIDPPTAIGQSFD